MKISGIVIQLYVKKSTELENIKITNLIMDSGRLLQKLITPAGPEPPLIINSYFFPERMNQIREMDK
jgi:hypothetical protein